MRHLSVLAVVVAIAALAIAAGVAIGSEAFASNALAELAGLAIGVLVAIIVADYLVEQRRRARWETVSGATIAAVADRLETLRSIILELVLLPEDEDRGLTDEPLPKALRRIGDSIANHGDEWGANTRMDFTKSPPARPANPHHLATGGLQESLGDFSSSQLLLHAVQPEAHFIRDMLTPRTLELATDTRLVEL